MREFALHEGISTPARRDDVVGCPRWPETLRLLSSEGELVRGRCKATNQCSYCARLAAVENSELLQLDALLGEAPSIVAILSTRDVEISPQPFYASRRKVIAALKRRWPDVHYACVVEFTTGYGPRSGGCRRPHWNLLLKGIPVDAVDDVALIVTTIWCAREKALPQAQYVAPIANAGGLMRYVAQHFQKQSQAPPLGWKGHRLVMSRGYLWAPAPDARLEARRQLRLKREVYDLEREAAALEEGLGVRLPADDAFARATERLAIAEALTWRVWRDRRHASPRRPPHTQPVPQLPVSRERVSGVYSDLMADRAAAAAAPFRRLPWEH